MAILGKAFLRQIAYLSLKFKPESGHNQKKNQGIFWGMRGLGMAAEDFAVDPYP
jgi:hypothetical protein